VAGTRQIRPPTRLNRGLPADIDYILRKALRTEPEERYGSVDAFADDIRALLEWRPVQARSGDIWYRARTFARRYRLPVAAAAITLVALSTGLSIANRERAIAQRRFLEVRQLANKLFDIDAEVRQAPGTTKARQLIVDTSLGYLRRLASEVRGDPELALEVGNAYMRLARVQGVPMPGNLGQMAQAEESLKSGERLVESVLSAQPGNRIAMLRSAQIAHDRMMLAWWLRQPRGESLTFAKKSAERLEEYVSTGPVDSAEIDAVLLTSINVATQYLREDQPDEALRISRRALDRARSLNRPRRAGALLEIIAGIDCQQGNLDEALGAIRESVKLMEPPKDTADVGKLINFTMVLMRQSQILDDGNGVSLGRPEEAATVLRRALQIAEGISRKDPNDFSSGERFAETGILLAHALRDTDARESVELYDRAYHQMAEFQTNSQARRIEVQALTGSIHPLLRLRRYAEGRPRLDAVFLRLDQLKLFPAEQVETGSETDNALRARAEYEAATGAPARALETAQTLMNLLLASKPQPGTRLSDALCLSNLYQEIAHLARQAQLPDLAGGFESRRLELWRRWNVQLPRNPFVRRQLEAAWTPTQVPRMLRTPTVASP
jgi:tetratricopeptide (TPR) repeat protein